ncbi:MAG: hypothetical protein ACR2FO_05460 [Actinomycetota bacterium]
MKLLLFGIVAVWASLMAIAAAAISGEEAQDDRRTEIEVFAEVDGRRAPIQKNSVIGQAEKTGGKCTLKGPVKGGAKISGDKAIAPVIRWGFDETCRIIVREITPGTPLGDASPTGGDVTTPKPAGGR